MTSESRVANYFRFLPDTGKAKSGASIVLGAVVHELLTDPHADIPNFLASQFASNQEMKAISRFFQGMGTALHWAVRMQDITMATTIVAAGTVDANAVNQKDGCTALHTAVRGENVRIVRALLAAGTVDVNAVDAKFALTALHMGVETRNIHVVRELLELKGRLRLTEESH